MAAVLDHRPMYLLVKQDLEQELDVLLSQIRACSFPALGSS
jgi:hypothetical protein